MNYLIMRDHRQFAAFCDSLASARATARRIRDAESEYLVRRVSIYSEDKEWIEDVPVHNGAPNIDIG